jgi:hypothetical protein
MAAARSTRALGDPRHGDGSQRRVELLTEVVERGRAADILRVEQKRGLDSLGAPNHIGKKTNRNVRYSWNYSGPEHHDRA